MKNVGNFFVFSGMEATGKTTIIKKLREKDARAVCIKEPNVYFREFLTSDKYDPDAYTELLAFITARSYNYHNFVIPSINNGRNVFADRWQGETYAYQCCAKGQRIDLIAKLYNIMINANGVVPKIEFILLCDPQVSLQRSIDAGHANRFENYGIDYHKKVYDGFVQYAETIPNSVIIDTNDISLEEVYNEIKSHIDLANFVC